VVVKVRGRRMRCPALDCKVQTFREQVPGVLERYQRRICRLTAQVSAVARELAGRASARLLPSLGIGVSRHTALRALLAIRLPGLEVPRVLEIDDFALRRGHVYATILVDAETGRRVDVLEGRTADVAGKWLREHPEAQVVTRDGSGAYGEAVRSALPDAVQCGDRWHLWHLLGQAAAKEVALTPPAGPRAPRCRRASARRSPGSAGSRSATCAARASACWTAPAAWAWP
jgi:transposase